MPKNILIVDDSAVVRSTFRQTFEADTGWRVCGEAVDGREGIEKAQQFKLDLIVLDLAMLVIDGLQAARELTRILPEVLLVMFTSYDSAQLQREALSAGVRTVVAKSASTGELISSI